MGSFATLPVQLSLLAPGEIAEINDHMEVGTAGDKDSRTLLFPATVELSITEVESVEHHAAEIRQMGFTVREFGGNSFIISTVPSIAGQYNPGELFADILARFGHGEEGKGSILASMACKAAVKAVIPFTRWTLSKKHLKQ